MFCNLVCGTVSREKLLLCARQRSASERIPVHCGWSAYRARSKDQALIITPAANRLDLTQRPTRERIPMAADSLDASTAGRTVWSFGLLGFCPTGLVLTRGSCTLAMHVRLRADPSSAISIARRHGDAALLLAFAAAQMLAEKGNQVPYRLQRRHRNAPRCRPATPKRRRQSVQLNAARLMENDVTLPINTQPRYV